MKFAIYQIQYSETEIQEINGGMHNEKFDAKNKMQFADDEIGGLASDAFDAALYTHVANIEADDLNQVFEIGNIGPNQLIERFGRMSSVSVGDIIVDNEGSMFVVAPMGFVAIGYKPALVA